MSYHERGTSDEPDSKLQFSWDAFNFPRNLKLTSMSNRDKFILFASVLTAGLVIQRLRMNQRDVDLALPDTSEDYPQAAQGDIVAALSLLGIQPDDIEELEDVCWHDPRNTSRVVKQGHRDRVISSFREGFDSIASLLRVREDSARVHHTDDALASRIKAQLIHQFEALFEPYEREALKGKSLAEVLERIEKRQSGEDSPY